MKFVLLTMFGLFGIGCAAHAHVPPSHIQKPAISVSIGWTWVSGHQIHGKWVNGYWKHPKYGKSHRAHIYGPPPTRPHAHSEWVPGHWEKRRGHKVWIRGHWVS